MSAADRLAERALAASDAAADPEVRRKCDYIAEQALYGQRTDADLVFLGQTLAIHTRNGAIQ